MDPYEYSDEEKNLDDDTNPNEDVPSVYTPLTFSGDFVSLYFNFPYTAAKFTSVCTC